MNHYIGLSDRALVEYRRRVSVNYEPAKSLTPHLLISGGSGSGKTHQSFRLLTNAIAAGIEVDVFTLNEDFDSLPGATVCQFSPGTRYGFNPMIISPNIHYGGVLRRVDSFLRFFREAYNGVTGQLEVVLRNLFIETYEHFGILQEKPETWNRRALNEADRLNLIGAGRESYIRHECFPTLEDLIILIKEKLALEKCGGDSGWLNSHQKLIELFKRRQSLKKDALIENKDEQLWRLEEQIVRQKLKCVSLYESSIEELVSWNIFDEAPSYQPATLMVILKHLALANSSGIHATEGDAG